MGFGGLLLLGDKNSSERMKYLKEIVHYLYSLRVDLLLKEIAAIREKSVEMSDKAASYKKSLNYKALQKEILSTNEYAGIP